jgi:hypothetical protein
MVSGVVNKGHDHQGFAWAHGRNLYSAHGADVVYEMSALADIVEAIDGVSAEVERERTAGGQYVDGSAFTKAFTKASSCV